MCINVATYGPGGRFAMTDRGASALRTTSRTFEVGPSKLTWTGEKLVIDIDEVSSPPLIGRMRGKITVTPKAVTGVDMALSADGAHIWRPFAPISSIEVDLDRPGWQWNGGGYFDANFGTRALEEDFSYWTWGRFPLGDRAMCFYDATRRDGSTLGAAVEFGSDGSATMADPPPLQPFARSFWRVRRETRGDAEFRARQVFGMLDAPFYCRSVVRTRINGTETDGVHEALDLDRFRGPWLMPMLALRVPRRSRWAFD